jgi:heme exporter protein C
MKYVIMLGAALLGVALGFIPPLSQRRPTWWKVLAILAVTLAVVIGLFPPIAGTVTDAVIAMRADTTKVVPVLLTPVDLTDPTQVVMRDSRDERIVVQVSMQGGLGTLQQDKPTIIELGRGDDDLHFTGQRVVLVDPTVTLPYIMGLEERARIIFFHVPMSWTATVAYLLSMIFAIGYLRTRSLHRDTLSMAAASVGTLYAVLATVTGAIWAKFNWGSFWNWDPRETSIFLLLLVYAAYFLLRGSIDDPERRARLSAAYSIVAFVTVPFLIFVLPRLLPGLHPGSSDDVNAGPLLSPKSDAINTTKQLVFGLSLFGFTMIFFWLMNLKVRISTLHADLRRRGTS